MPRVKPIKVFGVVKCPDDDCQMEVRETLWTTSDQFGEYARNLYVCKVCGHSEIRKGMFKHGVYSRRYAWNKEL